MEILDPYAHKPLAFPPPTFYDFPSVAGDAGASMDTAQLDDYLRAIGVLPPLPPIPGYYGTVNNDAVDMGLRQATHELYYAAAAVDDHVQPQPATPPASSSSSTYDDGSAATLAAYDSDIDANLRATERDARQRPSPDYLADDAAQGIGIDPLVRAALVAWMTGLAGHFNIGAAALHRAVSYTDRFLSSPTAAAVTSGAGDLAYRLRVVAAAAVYAAAKLEDRSTSHVMSARDIAACCGFAAAREVLDAERALLAGLGYRLGGPTAHTFVDHFTRRGAAGPELEELRRAAHAAAGLSLLDHRCCVRLLPSAVAAAAILLARMSLTPAHGGEEMRRWGRELEELTGYKPADVYEGVESMYMMLPDDPGFGLSPLLFADLS